MSKSLDMLFPVAWLEERREGDPRGRTNREIETEVGLGVLLSAEGFLTDRLSRTP